MRTQPFATLSGLCCLSVLLAACHSKPPPPEVEDEELQRFLNGMLVTSNIPPPEEPVWPVGDPGEEFSTMIGPVMKPFRERYDLPTPEALRNFLDVPVERMTRSHAWASGIVADNLTALKAWRKLLRDNPDDLEAAIWTGELTAQFEGPQAAVDALAATSGKTAEQLDDRSGPQSAGRLEGIRCEELFRSHHLDEARAACNLATELDEKYGQRTLAKVFLAMGKNKEALAQAEHVARQTGRMADPGALLTLGLAQQYNGLDAQAKTTWNLGLTAWPASVLLQRAVHGPKLTVFEWQDEELAANAWWYAERLAFGGHLLSELGLTDRANALYAESEREEPGHALPHQLVFLGMTHTEEALQKALAAVKSAEAAHAPSNVRLLSATAWLYLRLKKVEDAKRWVQKALDVWPWDPKAMSLMWQVCGEEKDYICVIKYRKRLGLPTHFNVAQYQDVKKAWEEQAVKNGVGLAARETASADAPKPPRVDSVVIVPLGWRVAPELEGMAAFLKKEFPSLKISVAEPEQPPAGAYDIERRAMLWERLSERLREEPGRIYVVEQDLSSLDRGFAYARYDLAHGRGVVSLARMRSLVGDPVDPENPSGDDEITRAVRHRLASELVHGVGELLGLSFPCQEPKCAMHERRSIRDFVLRTPSFCAKHQQELKDALARVGTR